MSQLVSGAHVIVYSKDADADRKFFKDVLELPHVDSGDGWLIFALPPTEMAMHPSDENGSHELFLTCEDVEATVKALTARKVVCSRIEDQRWGRLTHVSLPGGGKIGVYQPAHPRAHG